METLVYLLKTNAGNDVVYVDSETNRAKIINTASANGYFETVNLYGDNVPEKIKQYIADNDECLNGIYEICGENNDRIFDFDELKPDDNTEIIYICRF